MERLVMHLDMWASYALWQFMLFNKFDAGECWRMERRYNGLKLALKFRKF